VAIALGVLERKILKRIYGLTQEIAQWGIHYAKESRGVYKDTNVVMPLLDGGTRTQRMI